MQKRFRKATLALILGLSCTGVYAQGISGTVKDATGDPLIGVTIMLDGKPVAVTDIDGNYTIPNAKPNQKIKVSYIGYQDQEIAVGNRKRIDLTMKSSDKSLDEVVVIGYGRRTLWPTWPRPCKASCRALTSSLRMAVRAQPSTSACVEVALLRRATSRYT